MKNYILQMINGKLFKRLVFQLAYFLIIFGMCNIYIIYRMNQKPSSSNTGIIVEMAEPINETQKENTLEINYSYNTTFCTVGHLEGRLKINLKKKVTHNNFYQFTHQHGDISNGTYTPPDCIPQYHVAIIIPFRDRTAHLKILLMHLIPILKRQRIHYTLFVAEQYGKPKGKDDDFNKGVLYNAAVHEALKVSSFHCIIFHDVDLIPEDDRIPYNCQQTPNPFHMSVRVDKLKYKLPYYQLVGGVLNMRTSTIFKVNGFSNRYWGWGGEDDDLAKRILRKKFKIMRPSNDSIARYSTIPHEQRRWHLRNYKLARQKKTSDGINNVKYKLVMSTSEHLYRHILIDPGKCPHAKCV